MHICYLLYYNDTNIDVPTLWCCHAARGVPEFANCPESLGVTWTANIFIWIKVKFN